MRSGPRGGPRLSAEPEKGRRRAPEPRRRTLQAAQEPKVSGEPALPDDTDFGMSERIANVPVNSDTWSKLYEYDQSYGLLEQLEHLARRYQADVVRRRVHSPSRGRNQGEAAERDPTKPHADRLPATDVMVAKILDALWITARANDRAALRAPHNWANECLLDSVATSAGGRAASSSAIVLAARKRAGLALSRMATRLLARLTALPADAMAHADHDDRAQKEITRAVKAMAIQFGHVGLPVQPDGARSLSTWLAKEMAKAEDPAKPLGENGAMVFVWRSLHCLGVVPTMADAYNWTGAIKLQKLRASAAKKAKSTSRR